MAMGGARASDSEANLAETAKSKKWENSKESREVITEAEDRR